MAGIVGSIQSGSVVPVKSPAHFEGDEVVLTDGTRLRPDAVVVAAGYRQNLEPLVGDLGVLDARGLPRSHGAEPALPGLYFTGFTNPISGMFRELRIDATRIARAIRPGRRAARGSRGAQQRADPVAAAPGRVRGDEQGHDDQGDAARQHHVPSRVRGDREAARP